jgi:hypothetical protein
MGWWNAHVPWVFLGKRCLGADDGLEAKDDQGPHLAEQCSAKNDTTIGVLEAKWDAEQSGLWLRVRKAACRERRGTISLTLQNNPTRDTVPQSESIGHAGLSACSNRVCCTSRFRYLTRHYETLQRQGVEFHWLRILPTIVIGGTSLCTMTYFRDNEGPDSQVP